MGTRMMKNKPNNTWTLLHGLLPEIGQKACTKLKYTNKVIKIKNKIMINDF